jgi:hypothetical protein
MQYNNITGISCLDASERDRYRCRFIGRSEESAAAKVWIFQYRNWINWWRMESLKNETNHDLIMCHSLIHLESPCVKSAKMTYVVTVMSKLVNFFRSRRMNHHQFKDLLRDVEFKYKDNLCYTKVRWLNRGRMLKCLCDLESETKLFLETNVGKLFLSFVITTGCMTTLLLTLTSLNT